MTPISRTFTGPSKSNFHYNNFMEKGTEHQKVCHFPLKWLLISSRIIVRVVGSSEKTITEGLGGGFPPSAANC